MVALPSEDRTYYPNVRVVEHSRPGTAKTAATTSGVTVADPLEVPFLEPETQGFIEISESGGERRVITVVEIVCPTNKYAGRRHTVRHLLSYSLRHIPTGISVDMEVTARYLTKKERLRLQETLYRQLFPQLESRVARHLRIPGR